MRELRRTLRGADGFVDRQALDAGHGSDRRADPVPSTRNSGQIRSSAVSTCSRTMRRAHSARRLRRGRNGEIETVAPALSASTGAGGRVQAGAPI